ncbi:MAG: peptidylprolyl isomerase [Ruminococcaceae bacterium]|nr:peptidylprolyl isomerase [Oscillospiraceae bacterium]
MEHDAEFKKELEAVKKDLLANFYIEKFLRDVKVPESELQKYYDENPDKFQGNETVSASHILVDKEETALELLEKIQNGEISFEDAAKTSSTCPSGQKGGDLGEFGHGMMVKEFDEACFAMEPGELRGPIKTQFGYHLIRLDKKNPPRTISFSEAKDEIYRMLLSQAQQKAYQSKINQLRILYPVDYSSAL